MSFDPWPVFCSRCCRRAQWLVESSCARGTPGHRAAVTCDHCLPAVRKWATRAGHDPPQIVALHADEMTTLF